MTMHSGLPAGRLPRICRLLATGLALLLIALMAGGAGPAQAQPQAARDLSEASPAPDLPSPEDNSFTRTFLTYQDTYINAEALNTNYGASPDLVVKRLISAPYTFNNYSLLGFDLSVLPANAVIDNAVLQVYSQINREFLPGAPESITIVPDALLGDWEEMVVTWITRPSQENRGDTGTIYSSGWHNINVYNIVNAWQTGALSNYGISLRLGSSQLGTAIFHSRETGLDTTPRLVVTYHTEGSPAMLPVQEDTYIDQGFPSTNYGAQDYFRVGGGTSKRYSLLKFDLSTLPPNIEVTSAQLWLNSDINKGASAPTAPNDIYPHLVTTAWDEMSVTWNSNVQALYRNDPPGVYQIGWIGLDVTHIAQDWVSGTYLNQGIELRLGETGTSAYDFYAIPAQTRAYLLIEYTDAPPPCTPLSSVSLSGPTSGLTNTSYTFSAGITPPDASVPITYTFSATDFSPVSGPANSITYSWSTAGTKTVAVTAENCGGSQSTNLVIEIAEPPPDCPLPLLGLDIAGPTEGVVLTDYTFTSLIEPANATQPVTYLWEASNQPGTLTDPEATYNWGLAGRQAITLTAENCGGSFVAYHSFQALDLADLADLVVSSAWFEPDAGRIGFLIQNNGGRPVPAGFLVEVYQNGSLLGSAAFPLAIPSGAVRVGYLSSLWGCPSASGALEVRADTLNAVLESDEANNTFSDTWVCDLTAPNLVEGPTVSDITEHTATVHWATDDPTASRFTYGWSTSTPLVIEEPALRTDHTFHLTGLVSGMSYFYDIKETNENGQLLVVPREFFTTLPPGSDPPAINALTLDPYPLDDYEFFTLKAAMQDPGHTQRVEFYWDGTLLGTDYSFEGGFEFYISPHAQGWTRDEFFSGHMVKAVAYNLHGESTQLQRTIIPASASTPITLFVMNPGEGYQLYYQGFAAPAETYYTARVNAYGTEWKCTVSGRSSDNPGGLPGIPCEGMQDKLTYLRIRLYKDGALVASGNLYSPELITEISADLVNRSAGSYTAEIIAEYGSESISQTLGFELIEGTPPVELERTVTRTGNYFTVRLAITNLSDTVIEMDTIKDSLLGFQQVGYADESGSYTILPSSYFFNNRIVARPGFKVDYALNPGNTFYLFYQVVPVMYIAEYDVRIGQLPVRIILENGSEISSLAGADLVEDPNFSDPIPLNDSYLQALKSADYVLITNPWQASSYYGMDYPEDLQKVYGAMARLARLKNGVLAYIDTTNKHLLNIMLEPGSWWVDSLNPVFQETNQGYVLLVGETEVIPAFYEGTGTFVTYANIPDWVPYSDLRYAHTSGDTARPELVVGRILGNSPGQWLLTLQRTIDVYTGHLHWDGGAALAASGRGEGVTSSFIPSINIVDEVLDDAGIYSNRLHLYDYPHDDRWAVMGANVPGKDTIILFGHGNPKSWAKETFSPWNILNYSWEDVVPAVFALSCETGNYEDENDASVAEGFVNDAAGVYIGSTQKTEMWVGEWGVKKFTRHWANNPGTSFGQALNKLKSSAFSYDGVYDHGKQLAFSYNLYGDPKYAPSPDYLVQNEQAKVSLSEPLLANQPLAIQELNVSLPGYTVEPREGFDYVDIPGGDWLFRDGSYIVPMVVVAQDFPAGVWVQNVRLTAQESLTTTTGLVLPRLMSQLFCEDCLPEPLPPAPTGWVPALDENFAWSLQSNPDGSSTLYVTLYPFHYDGETTDALYYQDWTFEVETIATSLSVMKIQVDQPEYTLNSPVAISAWLENSAAAQDLYANLEIRRQVTGELAGSLPLQLIQDAAGAFSLSFEWDSAGTPAGGYYASLAVMDAQGNLLVQDSAEFDLGIYASQITEFSLSSTVFNPAVDETFHLEVLNSGDLPLDGLAIIEITAEGALTPTLQITHTITALPPGETLSFEDLWETSGETATAFTIKAYVRYASQASDPRVIYLDDRMEVYLPLVTR